MEMKTSATIHDLPPSVNDSDDCCICIESKVSKLKAKYQSSKLGSVKLCFEFFEKISSLVISVKNHEINKQCALDRFVELKTKINDQFRWRLFVFSVVTTMIDMDEFSAEMMDWLQSDPLDIAELPAEGSVKGSIYFNWKTVLGIKKDLFLYEIGMKELILEKLKSVDHNLRKNNSEQS